MKWFNKNVLVIAIAMVCLLKVQGAQAQITSDSCRVAILSPSKWFKIPANALPESVRVSSDSMEMETLVWQPEHNAFKVKQKGVYTICFQFIDAGKHFSAQLPYQVIKEEDLLDKGQAPLLLVQPKQEESLFSTPELYKSGSLVRGVSGGNNANVGVTSAMNVNLDGKLSDNLNIRASLTDQNVPFQPEGNTQQLQDFDNIFISLYNDNFAVSGGDLVLQNPKSHFMRYYKNILGGQLELNSKRSKTQLSVGGAKGQFASVVIPPLDGIMGPYKIPGPIGKRFVVVLINSEKVYLDGKLLSRGFERDYVINYDLGEITFNSPLVITQYSRLRIDYEYADQNFARTTVAASQEWNTKKWKFHLAGFSEKDNKNRPSGQELSPQAIAKLQEAGDALLEAWIPAYDSVPYVGSEVRYKKVPDDPFYFVHSTDPDSAFFRVSFSQVGMGNGDYVLDYASAVGRVYRYVGASNGDYVPYKLITPPNKKQMLSISGTFEDKGWWVKSELGVSSLDKNLFSSKDNADNNGMAVYLGIEKKMKKALWKSFDVTPFASMEWVGANFNPIDRYRPIEFDRNWNAIGENRFNDFILKAGVNLENQMKDQLRYSYIHRDNATRTKGHQHVLNFNKTLGDFKFLLDYTQFKTQFGDNASGWTQMYAETTFNKNGVVPGLYYEADKNEIIEQQTELLIGSNNFYEELGLFTRFKGDKNKTQGELRFASRIDKTPQSGELKDNTHYFLYAAQLKHAFQPWHSIALNGSFRHNQDKVEGNKEDIVNARINWDGWFAKKSIKSNLVYGIANGRVLKREFVYVAVTPGQGTHVWRDLNEDGAQSLDEFFEAILPDERLYIRLFNPTDDYVEAFENTLNYRLNIAAPGSWYAAGGLRKALSKFNWITSWRSVVKTSDTDLMSRFLPIFTSLDASKLLSQKSVFRNNLFFQKRSTRFGAELGLNYLDQKNLQTNGFEARNKTNSFVKLRFGIKQIHQFDFTLFNENSNNASDYIENRNYGIQSVGAAPSITFQSGANWRFSLKYRYTTKLGTEIESEEIQADLHQLTSEFNFSSAQERSVFASLSYTNIAYEGLTNTPMAYELLNALKPGNNYNWNISLTQRIIKGLNLTAVYNGRVSQNQNVVHFGTVSVAALF